MRERLLQFIWQHQHFDKQELTTIDGEPLHILNQGVFNTHQGPDFKSAMVKINGTTWAGNVELHTNSSDWDLHKHSSDKNYDNIILHVVWCHDKEIENGAGFRLATLELQSRVSKLLLQKFSDLMQNVSFIPCENQIAEITNLVMQGWLQRLNVERLEQRSKVILELFHQSNNHWEETLWISIAKNFGLPVNSEGFEKIARSIPLNILVKHKDHVIQLEALLFGQAGLLDQSFNEKYPAMLRKEYLFYQKKYGLEKIDQELYFLRMRPSNFPSIRLAQLAMLIHLSSHLFMQLIECSSIKEVRQLLEVSANDYWHYHYSFNTVGAFKEKHLGTGMINSILINTVIPVLFAYGLLHDEHSYKDRALQWLEEIASEKNSITRGFERIGLKNRNAADSQALIQLKKSYCNKKRCLDCAVGCAVLGI